MVCKDLCLLNCWWRFNLLTFSVLPLLHKMRPRLLGNEKKFAKRKGIKCIILILLTPVYVLFCTIDMEILHLLRRYGATIDKNCTMNVLNWQIKWCLRFKSTNFCQENAESKCNIYLWTIQPMAIKKISFLWIALVAFRYSYHLSFIISNIRERNEYQK